MAEQEAQISIQKIYLKDFSFESPNAPEVFTKPDWEPKTNLNIRSTHSILSDNNHEVVLTLTVETKHEDKTLFLVELHQAGIFSITLRGRRSGSNPWQFLSQRIVPVLSREYRLRRWQGWIPGISFATNKF